MSKQPPSIDNRANQLNPTHPSYYRSRGHSEEVANEMAQNYKANVDNRANQLNPNHVPTKNPQMKDNAQRDMPKQKK